MIARTRRACLTSGKRCGVHSVLRRGVICDVRKAVCNKSATHLACNWSISRVATPADAKHSKGRGHVQLRALRSNPPFWSSAAPLVLTAGVVWLQLFVPDATASTHEATEFSVPAGSPDEYMQAGATFARELDPNVEISFWDSQSGSLSVSRVEGDRVKCILRASPDIGEALKPLGRFLNGRIEPRAQAMFALAHTRLDTASCATRS